MMYAYTDTGGIEMDIFQLNFIYIIYPFMVLVDVNISVFLKNFTLFSNNN